MAGWPEHEPTLASSSTVLLAARQEARELREQQERTLRLLSAAQQELEDARGENLELKAELKMRDSELEMALRKVSECQYMLAAHSQHEGSSDHDITDVRGRPLLSSASAATLHEKPEPITESKDVDDKPQDEEPSKAPEDPLTAEETKGGDGDAGPDAPVLPEGWVELMDESSGYPYYFHEGSMLTQWDFPTAAVKLAPDGVLDQQQGLYYNALQSYTCFPPNLKVIAFMVAFCAQRELYVGAIHFLPHWVWMEPTNNKPKLILASCFRRLNMLDESVKMYKDILQQDPDQEQALRCAVAILRHMDTPDGDLEAKLDALNKAAAPPSGDSAQLPPESQAEDPEDAAPPPPQDEPGTPPPPAESPSAQ